MLDVDAAVGTAALDVAGASAVTGKTAIGERTAVAPRRPGEEPGGPLLDRSVGLGEGHRERLRLARCAEGRASHGVTMASMPGTSADAVNVPACVDVTVRVTVCGPGNVPIAIDARLRSLGVDRVDVLEQVVAECTLEVRRPVLGTVEVQQARVEVLRRVDVTGTLRERVGVRPSRRR